MWHLNVHPDFKSEDEGYSDSERTELVEVERKVKTKVKITEESCKDVKVEGFIERQSSNVILENLIEEVKIEGFIKGEGKIVKTEESMEEEKTNDTIIEVYHYRGTTSSSKVYKFSFYGIFLDALISGPLPLGVAGLPSAPVRLPPLDDDLLDLVQQIQLVVLQRGRECCPASHHLQSGADRLHLRLAPAEGRHQEARQLPQELPGTPDMTRCIDGSTAREPATWRCLSDPSLVHGVN